MEPTGETKLIGVWDANNLWSSAKPNFDRWISQTELRWVPREGLREKHVSKVSLTYSVASDVVVPVIAEANFSTFPFVYICLISPKNIDEYKSVGKPIVQKAASMLDWKSIRIIFLLAAKDAKEFNSKAYKKILERMRNELGLGKERALRVCLDLPTSTRSDEHWERLATTLQQDITDAFDERLTANLTRQRAFLIERETNSIPFAMNKDDIGQLFLMMRFMREAFNAYDAIEASIMENPDHYPASSAEDIEKSEELLVDKGPQTSLLMLKSRVQEKMTYLQWRMYTYYRKIEILGILGRPLELGKYGLSFVHSMKRELKRLEVHESFRNVWSFTIAMGLLHFIQQWSATADVDWEYLAQIQGDAYLIARQSLVRLASLAGLTTCESINGMHRPIGSATCEIAHLARNESLKKAVTSQDGFDRLYIELSAAATRMYETAKRGRQSVNLNADVGYVYFSQEKFSEAEALLKHQATMYSMDGWGKLYRHVLHSLSQCQRKLEHYREYVSSCLALACDTDISESKRAEYGSEAFRCIQYHLEARGARDMGEICAFEVIKPAADSYFEVGEDLVVSLAVTFHGAVSMKVDKVQVVAHSIEKLLTKRQPPALTHHLSATDDASQSSSVDGDYRATEEIVLLDADSVSPVDSGARAAFSTKNSSLQHSTDHLAQSVVSLENMPAEDLENMLIFELSDVVLSPGRNVLDFPPVRLFRGLEYFMDMVVINIGMMQLTHSFQTRREQLMFSVKLGTSNAVLDLKTPTTLVPCAPQRLEVIVHSNQDNIREGMISIESTSGMKIFDMDDVSMRIISTTKDDGPESEKEEVTDIPSMRLEGGMVPFPKCESGQKVRFEIAVQSPEDEDCMHVTTEEVFQVESAMGLQFHVPFMIDYRLASSSDGSNMLEVEVLNDSRNRLCLTSSRICCGADGPEITPVHSSQQTVEPRASGFYLFNLQPEPLNECTDGIAMFCLDYAFVGSSDGENVAMFHPQRLQLTSSFDVSRYRLKPIEITVRGPTTGFVGDILKLEIECRIPDDIVLERDSGPYFVEMEGYKSMWMVQGHKRSCIWPRESRTHTFSVLCVPVTIGLLDSPSFHVVTVEPFIRSESFDFDIPLVDGVQSVPSDFHVICKTIPNMIRVETGKYE
eukprot:TRINITY_DN1523_c0_g1_i2.p1 TRINITY_DN1523_c0_g1~~TRINITY_DN1523_c0_g1_i2.p1  ORF type:complete len:1164 (+),score=278.02 TRINITY_DN1523_c0_g1_i2:85-3492(+)